MPERYFNSNRAAGTLASEIGCKRSPNPRRLNANDWIDLRVKTFAASQSLYPDGIAFDIFRLAAECRFYNKAKKRNELRRSAERRTENDMLHRGANLFRRGTIVDVVPRPFQLSKHRLLEYCRIRASAIRGRLSVQNFTTELMEQRRLRRLPGPGRDLYVGRPMLSQKCANRNAERTSQATVILTEAQSTGRLTSQIKLALPSLRVAMKWSDSRHGMAALLALLGVMMPWSTGHRSDPLAGASPNGRHSRSFITKLCEDK